MHTYFACCCPTPTDDEDGQDDPEYEQPESLRRLQAAFARRDAQVEAFGRELENAKEAAAAVTAAAAAAVATVTSEAEAVAKQAGGARAQDALVEQGAGGRPREASTDAAPPAAGEHVPQAVPEDAQARQEASQQATRGGADADAPRWDALTAAAAGAVPGMQAGGSSTEGGRHAGSVAAGAASADDVAAAMSGIRAQLGSGSGDGHGDDGAGESVDARSLKSVFPVLSMVAVCSVKRF